MSTRKQNVVKRTPSKTTAAPKTTDEMETRRGVKKDDSSSSASMKSVSRINNLGKTKVEIAKPLNGKIRPKILKESNKPGALIKKTERTKTNSIARTKIETRPKQLVPNKPTGSRVAKSEFFPTKQMYSNALNTKTLKIKEESSSDTSLSSTLERPRTATLRKGSIVNMNIAGPEAPQILQPVPTENHSDEYEDDFDSYASDFEEYTSSHESSQENSSSAYEIETNLTSSSSESDDENGKPRLTSDEEKKLDSGNFDLPDTKHVPILDNINETAETNTTGSLSDEGFEEAKSLQFVNFLGAKLKQQRVKSMKKRNRRGEELMSMIRLEHQDYTLYEKAPVAYSDFIKIYGNKNSLQIASQTGEDDVSEETQTESFEMLSKWTQFPSKFSFQNENLELYKSEYLGVGGDQLENQSDNLINYNIHNLNKFLLNAAIPILTILAENKAQTKEIEIKTCELPFSDGYLPLNTNQFMNRHVACIQFFGNKKLLTVHGRKTNEKELEINLQSIGCVWNLANLVVPEEMFTTYGEINCATFGNQNEKLIFGGLTDGTVTVWDLSDVTRPVQNYFDFEKQFALKSISCRSDVDFESSSKIIAIHSLGERTTSGSGDGMDVDVKYSLQILTLDEIGSLVTWGLIFKTENNAMLVKNLMVSLTSMYPDMDDLLCTGMCINSLEPNHIYISTNYGHIAHCLATGSKANPRRFVTEFQSASTCLEECPFVSGHFIAGYANGNICLFSRVNEKPLMTLCNQSSDGQKTELLAWSINRPCVFYTIDANNSLHVWNLAKSDLFPIHTVPYKEKISSVKLSKTDEKDRQSRTYMALVSENGSVHLHVLNNEHGIQRTEEFQNDLKKFTNYVKRL